MSPTRVGVGIVIWRHNNGRQEVLLGKRKGSHGAGEWSFPGGKVEGKERPAVTAEREVEEEIGCALVSLRRMDFWSHDIYDELDHAYLTLYYKGRLYPGEEPKLMEPDKCVEWRWFGWVEDLPTPLFAGIRELREIVRVFSD